VTTSSPRVRLGLFVACLAVVLGVAFGVGSLGDPVQHTPKPAEVGHVDHG